MTYIKRHLEDAVLNMSRSFSAILVTGPRQSGKTTMLKKLAAQEGNNRGYVSLDDLNERSLAKEDPALFLQIHRPPVLIDEVQYAPELFTYIKIYIDEHHDPGSFWMTGCVYYSSYLSTYIERDVRELSGAIDSLKFVRFITAATARAGQIVNYHSLAEDADIDQTTAKNWLNILETLGIVFLLHPYSNNVLKRTIKTPKLYFYDTGLICYLTKWSSPKTAMLGAMNGALLENYAVSEIMKSFQNAAKEPFIYYYRDRDAKEIDVILESDGRLCPLEIKKAVSPEKKLTKVFQIIDRSPLQRGTGGVLCMAETFGAFDKDNLIVPIWMI